MKVGVQVKGVADDNGTLPTPVGRLNKYGYFNQRRTIRILYMNM